MNTPRQLAGTYVLVACTLAIQAQPTIEWQECLGGTVRDEAQSIRQTTDGGFIVAGTASSSNGDLVANNGGFDMWVVKLDVIGDLQWQRNLGGSWHDAAADIQQTSDGGYIAAGYTYSNDGDVNGNHDETGTNGTADIWVVKLDINGNLEWQKALGGAGGEGAASIQQTSDGGYILAGGSSSTDGDVTGNHGSSDFWIVKLNWAGGLQWQKCLGGSNYDGAQSIQQTNEGGYIVAGKTISNDGDVSVGQGIYDFWVVKLTNEGSIEWEKVMGSSSSDSASDIIQTEDGGYLVVGEAGSSDGDVSGHHGGETDWWVVKLDNTGSIQWQKALGGSLHEAAMSVEETGDYGYVVAGWTHSNDGDVEENNGGFDAWVVRLDGSGDILWQDCLGGSGNESANEILVTSESGYITAGYAESSDGDVIGFQGGADCWIVKSGPEGVGVPESMRARFYVEPNPTTAQISITLGLLTAVQYITLLDAAGRKLFEVQQLDGPGPKHLDLGSYEDGMYLLQVTDVKGRRMTERVVKN